jgi:hypothetical protein
MRCRCGHKVGTKSDYGHTYAQQSTDKREAPMVELEARPPAGCIKKVKQKT